MKPPKWVNNVIGPRPRYTATNTPYYVPDPNGLQRMLMRAPYWYMSDDDPKPKVPEEKADLPILAKRAVMLKASRMTRLVYEDGTDAQPMVRRYKDPVGAAWEAYTENQKHSPPLVTLEETWAVALHTFFGWEKIQPGRKPARCKGDYTAHDAPFVDCQCGYYSIPINQKLDEDYKGMLTAVVSIGGRVIESECSDGDIVYRSEYQVVQSLVIPPCVTCGREMRDLRALVLYTPQDGPNHLLPTGLIDYCEECLPSERLEERTREQNKTLVQNTIPTARILVHLSEADQEEWGFPIVRETEDNRFTTG